ncbi:MAG: DUF2029 domain-containing protein, partial [Chloroflexaceae bacterium]|nr:DUF2029 domain-containing protein [Chloroflexaceae bacterium]
THHEITPARDMPPYSDMPTETTRQQTWRQVGNGFLIIFVIGLAIYIGVQLDQSRLPPGYDARAYLGATHVLGWGQNPLDHHTISGVMPEEDATPWPGVGFDVPRTPFYLYPPFLAITMHPLTLLPYGVAMKVWLITVVAASLCLLPVLQRWTGWKVAAIGVIGCVQVWHAAWLGQVNAFLALLLALAMYSYERRNDVSTGLLLALGLMLKITPIIGILVLAARRTWFGVFTAGVVVVGIIIWTLRPVPFEWWSDGFGAALGERWHVAGFISWTGMLDYLWGDAGITFSIVLSGLMLFITLMRAPRVPPALSLAAASLLPLLVAHMAWDHHTVMALPALAVIYSTGRVGRGLAVVAWLTLTFGSGIIVALLITLCWIACCWPVLLSLPHAQPVAVVPDEQKESLTVQRLAIKRLALKEPHLTNREISRQLGIDVRLVNETRPSTQRPSSRGDGPRPLKQPPGGQVGGEI